MDHFHDDSSSGWVQCTPYTKLKGANAHAAPVLPPPLQERVSMWSRNGYGIYIPLTLPLKECIQVRTKLSEGQLFTFRDQQDSCLPSAARLDSPEDQGKGKVGPRKVLFLQEYNFLQG